MTSPSSQIDTSDDLRVRNLIRFLIKLFLFPFRFCWLLIVWVKLRIGALRG